MQLTVKAYKGICRTPALHIAVEGWLELLREGLCEHVTLLSWDNDALVAFDADMPIGVLTYGKANWAKEWQIGVGYVRHGYRRRGVYTKLWDELVLLAGKADPCPMLITSSTRFDNHAMRSVAAKQGRTERGVLLNYRLPGL